MISLNDVINFLIELLGNPDRLAAFEADPDTELHKAGLDGLTGQDVRDAELVMADTGVARADDDGGGSGGGGGGGSSRSNGGDDPVQAISNTTRNFTVTEAATPQNIINIDDRDTIINDSFNSDDDITLIDADNSFNKSVENDVIAIRDDDTTIINDNDTINDNDIDVDINNPGGQPNGEQPNGADPKNGDPNDPAPKDADPANPTPGADTSEDAAQNDRIAADDGEPDSADQQSAAAEPEPEPEPEDDTQQVDEAEADVDEPVDVAAV